MNFLSMYCILLLYLYLLCGSVNFYTFFKVFKTLFSNHFSYFFRRLFSFFSFITHLLTIYKLYVYLLFIHDLLVQLIFFFILFPHSIDSPTLCESMGQPLLYLLFYYCLKISHLLTILSFYYSISFFVY